MTDFFSKNDITAPQQITSDIPPNEILLSFRNDSQAEAFLDWFYDNGRTLFIDWCDVHGDNYRK